MPKRGSVQLLLLSLRPRATLGWGIGATVVILLLAGLAMVRQGFPLLEKAGIAQALRQSVWEQALAGQSRPDRWPWEDLTINMSLAPTASVPRLGLSAAIGDQMGDTAEQTSPAPHRARAAADTESATPLGDVALSDVAIGDSITFTAADGATCVYRVTGRPVVDPHLAEREAEQSDGTASVFSCGPLDRVMADEPPALPQTADGQQKL